MTISGLIRLSHHEYWKYLTFNENILRMASPTGYETITSRTCSFMAGGAQDGRFVFKAGAVLIIESAINSFTLKAGRLYVYYVIHSIRSGKARLSCNQ